MFRITVVVSERDQTSLSCYERMKFSVDFRLRFNTKFEMHMSHMNVVGVAQRLIYLNPSM